MAPWRAILRRAGPGRAMGTIHMITLVKFTALCFAVGLLYPAAFATVWAHADPYLKPALEYGRLLWPTSGLALDALDDAELDLGALTLSATSNALLYAVIGAVVWSSIRKKLWLLVPLVVAIGVGWYYMLGL